MKILVTGGAGFIGSHLVDAYIEQGHDVVVLDDLSTGKTSNINPKARVVVADVNTNVLDELMAKERFDVVNHHAAHMELRASLLKPLHDANVNVLGSIRLLNAARETGVGHVVLASTTAIYGAQVQFPADESHPIAPLSPYGASKYSMELYAEYFRRVHQLSVTSLRYSTVYGPRQNPHGESGVVAIFLERFIDGRQATIHGDGEQTRDYVHVHDVVASNMLASQHKLNDVYVVASNTEVSVNELVRLMRQTITIPIDVVHGPKVKGDAPRTLCCADKLTNHTGWRPSIGIEQGIATTAAWFIRTKVK